MSCPVLVLTLLATTVVRGNTSPFPGLPLEGGRNGLALALQKEKFQFGGIGCTFSDSVCDLSLESCFNDNAFGKCVPVYGNPTMEDSFRYNLKRDDVQLLELAMGDLFQKGFRWGHSYTQCILQNLLFNIRNRIPPSEFNCIEDPVESDEEEVKGQLSFLNLPPPPAENQPRKLPDYVEKDEELLENALANELLEDYLDGNAREDSGWEESSAPDSEIGPTPPKIFAPSYNTPEKFRKGIETRDDLAFLNEQQPPASQMTSDLEVPVELQLSDEELAQVANVMSEIAEAAKAEELEAQVVDEIKSALDGNREDERSGDSIYSEGGLVFLNNPKRFLYGGERGEDDEEGFELGTDLRPSGFERRERLDVKKPGPWYRTVNNFAFDKRRQKQLKPEGRMLHFNPEFGGLGPADMKIQERDTSGQEKEIKTEEANKVSPPEVTGSEEVNQLVNLIKKAESPAEASKLAQQVPGTPLEIVDTSYVTIQLGKKIGSWSLAHDLVTLIADFMDIKHSTFQQIRIQDDLALTFKVASNKKGLTASDVAKGIEDLKSDLEKELDVSIISAVAGVKASKSGASSGGSESVDEDADDDGGEIRADSPSSAPLILADGTRNRNLYIGIFALCGTVAAALVASFFIFIIRRSAKSRENLAKLAQDDPAMESCKDYQELCRARMASKNHEKVEPIRAVQRVQSNVSEGGTSSSRSSTSSWSEEPVLTNMDISTGHMVLSYMEDHLKKKDRLDQEWAALCTYEADPGSTSIGEKAENQKKNRYSNSLPYDHSRVILNDLANISGSDYINASTITDHDPRNPAYIATQGPLPNTAADFWQLVWEQGSVVIVTLTRLAENGTTLCHRYWPEEGSELHHIYEVHLVSEHIWCEEYLVRSFYLKNLKTGETRTVTQFHFLAWPENGIPTSAKSLLEFRRKVNKSYRGRSCPIIVHCSDGAGRTGTYALIDMVLNRMTKGAKEIDIAASLEHIRDQRPGMVRTKQQFEFVLMAVAEEVHAILKALPQ